MASCVHENNPACLSYGNTVQKERSGHVGYLSLSLTPPHEAGTWDVRDRLVMSDLHRKTASDAMWEEHDVRACAGVPVAGRGVAQPQLKYFWIGGGRQAAHRVGYTTTR